MQREPTHTQEEHANSTQKGPSQDSNLEPSSCEAVVLTTTPLCSPVHPEHRNIVSYSFSYSLRQIKKKKSISTEYRPDRN